MSYLTSELQQFSVMSYSPIHEQWPDDMHWEIISYLASVENNKLDESAIRYIITVTNVSKRNLNKFLITYKGSDSLQPLLRGWQFSQVEQLIQMSQEEYVDSEEEEAVLEQSYIKPSTFLALSAESWASQMQRCARAGNWSVFAQMRASGRKIPPNTYSILIEESICQGERTLFQQLLQGRTLINYEKLIKSFKRYKAPFDALTIIQGTSHYKKITPSQRQQLDAAIRR
jgi:hypothetical protein